MRRQYSVSFENVAITAAQDLFLLIPGADKPIRLVGLTLSNVGGAADAGDAQEELLRVSIRQFSGATITNGSGGTTPTPVPVDPNDAAAGFTAHANDTTRASTSGTNRLWLPDGWNVRIPYAMWFPDGFQVEASTTNGRIVIGLDSAPADSLSVSGCAFVEEE